MYQFSHTSKTNLATAHSDLQTVFNQVIQFVDCSVVYGHRTPEEQFALYEKGRKYINGKKMVVDDPQQVVTNCDGTKVKSDHNQMPSAAVDVIPYPEGYSDQDKIKYFAGFVMGIAQMFHKQGIIENQIGCGIDWDGDWDLKDQKLYDAVHFFIKKPN